MRFIEIYPRAKNGVSKMPLAISRVRKGNDPR
jgi:hypothetical protein